MTDPCLGNCNKTIFRKVLCYDPKSNEERDPLIYCPPGSNAGEKPTDEIKCPPCNEWTRSYGECQYRSDKKSCRLNQAVQPFTWTCLNGNCGPKPADPTESEYQSCTMPCFPFETKMGSCLNPAPDQKVKCQIGQPMRDVQYVCNQSDPDMCEQPPEESGLKPCFLPQCLEWTQEEQFPLQPCRVINQLDQEQTCGEGIRLFTTSCPEISMCNPHIQPTGQEPCVANKECKWKYSELPWSEISNQNNKRQQQNTIQKQQQNKAQNQRNQPKMIKKGWNF